MSKQKLLIKPKKPIIIYDYREERSEVWKYLQKMDCILVKQNLTVGDYLVGEEYGIERKNADDFLQSIYSGRLFDQIKRLKEVYEKPILIIENFGKLTLLDKDWRTVLSICADFYINYNGLVVFSRSPEDTAYFIYKLAYYEQIASGKVPTIGIKKKQKDPREIAISILMNLPGIGRKKAEEILNRFGSLKNFINASYADLISLKLGSDKAKLIKQIFETDFRQKSQPKNTQ